jgi:hypothetical protein
MDMVTAAVNQVENAHPYLSVVNAWITVSANTGTCKFNIPPNTAFSLPNTTYLPAFDLLYVEGDVLLFDTADSSNEFLGVIIDGPIIQWGDFNCTTNSAFGIDGDTLGCIAIASSWLAYSVYLNGGPQATTPARSLPSSDYHFQAHSDWQTTENCTMTCMLLNSAPQNNWTSVGNGTYCGVFHELHFKHTDTFIGYRAAQEVNPGSSTLAARQYVTSGNEVDSGNTGVYVDMYSLKRQFEYDASFDAIDSFTGNPYEVADWMGESIEESVALSNSSGLCVSSLIGDEISSSEFFGITQAAGDWGTEQEIEEGLNTCASGVLTSIEYGNAGVPMTCGEDLSWIDPDLLVYPDGNPAPDIQSTSTSYPGDTDSVLSDRWLEKRAGASQPYKIYNLADASRQTWVTWFSAPYVNGANGVNLQNAGGDTHVWALANAVSCLDSEVISNAPITGPGAIVVHAEHLFERVTIAYLLEFAQVLQIDLDDGNGVVVPVGAQGLNPIPYSMIVSYMAIPYANWPNFQGLGLDPTRSLFTDLANALGSTSNPYVMTNLEGSMNLMKARVWDTIVDPTSDTKWNALASNPSEANTAKALSLIQVVSFPQVVL